MCCLGGEPLPYLNQHVHPSLQLLSLMWGEASGIEQLKHSINEGIFGFGEQVGLRKGFLCGLRPRRLAPQLLDHAEHLLLGEMKRCQEPFSWPRVLGRPGALTAG